MQLSPRYDGPPLLLLDLPGGDPSEPVLRQRQRLAEALADLDAEQWAAPSRCEGWSAQDVVTHLVSTNQFWAISITAGLSGEPTRFLATFDPVASPAQMVAKARGRAPAAVLEGFVESNLALAAALASVDEGAWCTTVAEAPPGHVALRAVALHALWDSWVHERDVLPLGLPAVVEDDEVVGCLQYGAALGPAFLASAGSTRVGAYVVEATDPQLRCVVELGATVRVHDGDAPDGAVRITGSAVDLLEALSYRIPLDVDVPSGDAWMFGGLAEVFDRA